MDLMLRPDALWPALVERTRHALACGAMQPVETTGEIVRDAGVDFLVRRLASLARKEQAKERNEQAAKPANPFLPHEPDLFVADVSDTHFALLNKYNVIAHHLLIVTRRFVDQETIIDEGDFLALAACMAQMDGLAIYNSGAVAGASQPHKHLQLVPLPLPPEAPGGLAVPMEALFVALGGRGGMLAVPGLPFRHAFAWMEEAWFGDPALAGAQMQAVYRALLAAVGLPPDDGGRHPGPYNLLATRRWMLAVPRSRDVYDGVSVNSLGYAGSMFVRDEAQMATLRRAGPMAVLAAVALSEMKPDRP